MCKIYSLSPLASSESSIEFLHWMCVFRRIVKYWAQRLNARYSLVVCRFYANGYSRSFITLSELTSQHRIWSYTVSCLQLIISFYRVSSFVAVERFASFVIGWLRAESLSHPKKSVPFKGRKKRKHVTRADVTHGSSELNRSQATNGSTLSIGYIHWETECKIKTKKTAV